MRARRSALAAAGAALGAAAALRRRRHARERVVRTHADGRVEELDDERLLARAREALRAVKAAA